MKEMFETFFAYLHPVNRNTVKVILSLLSFVSTFESINRVKQLDYNYKLDGSYELINCFCPLLFQTLDYGHRWHDENESNHSEV